ncbi:hypothetical protein JW933_11055 [candidate division FCPU426 bacterium]|nr:hypothetical protein [candidate division FCPU426 bacterium]
MPARNLKPKAAKSIRRASARKDEWRLYWLAYNVALEPDVLRLLETEDITAYTRWDEIKGGGRSGPHLNNDVWPGVNNCFMFAAPAAAESALRDGVKKIRERFPGEGIKLIIQPCLEIV